MPSTQSPQWVDSNRLGQPQPYAQPYAQPMPQYDAPKPMMPPVAMPYMPYPNHAAPGYQSYPAMPPMAYAPYGQAPYYNPQMPYRNNTGWGNWPNVNSNNWMPGMNMGNWSMPNMDMGNWSTPDMPDFNNMPGMPNMDNFSMPSPSFEMPSPSFTTPSMNMPFM